MWRESNPRPKQANANFKHAYGCSDCGSLLAEGHPVFGKPSVLHHPTETAVETCFVLRSVPRLERPIRWFRPLEQDQTG